MYLNSEYIKMMNVIIIGDSYVGKTSIVRNFLGLPDTDTPLYPKRIINVLNDTRALHLSDATTSLRTIRAAHAIIVVCDPTNFNLDDVKSYLLEIERFGKSESIIVLVANKLDLQYEFVIDQKYFENLASSWNHFWAFVSAKTGAGIEELFEKIAELHINPQLKETKIKNNQLCLVNGINGKKRSSLIKAKLELEDSSWNEKAGMLFWKRAPKYVTLTRALLSGELNSLSSEQIDDLYAQYLAICKEASVKTKGVDPDAKVLFHNLYLSTFTPQEKLHCAASTLFKQSPLPFELIEPILKMAGQILSISANEASVITEIESNHQKSLMSLYFLCMIFKKIHQDINKGRSTIVIEELREIEENLVLEKKGGLPPRTVLQLNQHKHKLVKKYGGKITTQLYNTRVQNGLEQLDQTNLADHNYDDLINAFKSTCDDAINPHKKLKHAAHILFQFTPLNAEQVDPIIKMVAKSLNVSQNEASEITESEKAFQARK